MKSITKHIYFFGLLCGIFYIVSCSSEIDTEFTEKTKIALRNVGNELLLIANDSTSVVKPIIEVKPKQFKLAFGRSLSIKPNDLINLTRESFDGMQLPKFYRVEVIHCSDGEVAYSYQITDSKASTLIPCSGRELPNNCYTLEVKFSTNSAVPFTRQGFFYGYVIGVVVLLLLYFYKKRQTLNKEFNTSVHNIGRFRFYPEEHKLVKSSDEIQLSNKECELLSIFVAKPNTIIKRDELIKRVWEDNGVIVGRSLDTYISKLRKKLQEDETIKLTNVHGVGYKLEID